MKTCIAEINAETARYHCCFTGPDKYPGTLSAVCITGKSARLPVTIHVICRFLLYGGDFNGCGRLLGIAIRAIGVYTYSRRGSVGFKQIVANFQVIPKLNKARVAGIF